MTDHPLTRPAYQIVWVTGVALPDTLVASVWRYYADFTLSEDTKAATARITLDQPQWYEHDEAFFQRLVEQGVIQSYTYKTVPGWPSRLRDLFKEIQQRVKQQQATDS